MAPAKGKAASSPKKKSSSNATARKPRTSLTSPKSNHSKRAEHEKRFNQRFNVEEQSAEEILKLQMAHWTSPYYNHFTLPPDISPQKMQDGSERIYYVFRCKQHPSVAVQRERIEDSTSNLSRHAKACDPQQNATTEALGAFARGSSFSIGRFRFLIAKWVSRNYRPYSIIEDEELVEIFQMFDCRATVHGRMTVSRDVLEMFNASRNEVQLYFKNYTGRVHIGMDGWTSPNVYSFLGVTIHYQHEGQMKTIILDFIKLTHAHTGKYLAERLYECLKEFNLDTKILGIVCDNASNNDTLIESLQDRIEDWGGALCRVRCFAHVLNLVVKAILSVFTAKKKRNAAGIEVYEDIELRSTLEDIGNDDDEEDDQARREDEDDGEAEADEAAIEALARDEDSEAEYVDDVRQGQVTVEKLKGLAKAVFHSPTIRESLQQECRRADPPLDYHVLVRPVATRWNSLTMTIKSALKIRPALNALVDLSIHNRVRSTRLRRFALDEDEWTILEQLLPLLDRFLVVTEVASRSAHPLLHMVIPYIDQLTEAMEKWSKDPQLHPAVRMASKRGWIIMNKYYGLTDDSVMYRIAMIMHPRRKTAYFRSAKWPESWIQTAIDIARTEWVKNYKLADTATSNQATVDLSESQTSYFTDMDVDNNDDADAFELYISSPPIPTVTCPISYWYALEQTGDPLAKMALHFLTCPAASTDVERAFSRGRLTVSRMRHNLSDESTRASTILSSWFKQSYLIPTQSLIKSLGSKQCRPNNGGNRASEGIEETSDVDLNNNEETDLDASQ